MAKHVPQRYNPGELERTREHIGKLSPDEAKRMAQRLGGEVGVERTDSDIARKYEKIAALNRRRVDRYVPPAQRAAAADAAADRAAAERARSRPVAESVRPRHGYLDRVRMSFTAARPEHQVMTLPRAIGSLLSFSANRTDTINPNFIRNGDQLFFKPVENLVLAVRQLLARNAKNSVHVVRTPYLLEILTILKDWDIEGISRELSKLQRNPRGVTFEDCRPLTILLYRPLLRLIDLDPMYHVARALKQVHDLDLLELPKDSPDLPKIKLQYNMARDNLLTVTRVVRAQCYPLLLKLAAVRYSASSEFFDEQRALILSFLGLSPDEVLQPKDLSALDQPPPAAQASEQSAPESEEAAPEQNVALPERVERGLEVLDDLFPEAGFLRLEEFPDLYPFFHPLFTFPKGVELIPPEDPLQQVIVLLAILQELFYGFRAIRFKTFMDEHEHRVLVNERVEELTGNWHLFLDEVVGKNYAQSLDEFCRQVERNREFRLTDYGDKIANDLLWTKRRFLLPNLRIKPTKGPRPNFAANLPRLPEVLGEMKELLLLILNDIESGNLKSIENPWDEFSFAIQNFFSKRLRIVLARRINLEPFLRRRTSNASLLFHTLLVIEVLDHLANSPTSFYYEADEHPLFRIEPARPGLPLYTVHLEDPYTIVANADEARAAAKVRAVAAVEPTAGPRASTSGAATIPPVSADGAPAIGGAPAAGLQPLGPTTDRVTGMALLRELSAKATTLIKTSEEGGPTFTLLGVGLRRFADLSKQHGASFSDSALRATAAIISGALREFADIPYRVGTGSFIVLLQETAAADAVHLAQRIGDRMREMAVEGVPLAVSLGIVEHQKGWSVERLFKATENAVRDAGRAASPSIALFDPVKNVNVPTS